MSLILSEIPESGGKKKDYGRLEDGNHLARIVSVIDWGLQPMTDYETKKPSEPKHRFSITYETPDEFITYKDKDGNEVTKPRWISKEDTLVKGEKANLTKLIKALKPDLTSLDEFLNVPCMINIGSTKANADGTGNNAKVVSVSKPMKGTEVGELVNDAFYFDSSHPNMELFNGLLAWQQKKVKEALDYNGFADAGTPTTDAGNDEF